jgi:hypothetical protein
MNAAADGGLVTTLHPYKKMENNAITENDLFTLIKSPKSV